MRLTSSRAGGNLGPVRGLVCEPAHTRGRRAAEGMLPEPAVERWRFEVMLGTPPALSERCLRPLETEIGDLYRSLFGRLGATFPNLKMLLHGYDKSAPRFSTRSSG